MEFSQEFFENSIFQQDFLTYKQDYQEVIDEIITMMLVEPADQENIIQAIRKTKMLRYQEARKNFREREYYARELYSPRKVLLSLLKGLIATTSISQLSEITNSKIRWQKYDDQQDRNDPQGHHNLVYREFKKVESLEELEKFNNYFHNYILDLVYGLSDTFIRRTRFTIDYFRDDKQFESSCAKGTINLEKFEKDLAEGKAFIPGPSDFVPDDDKPAPSDRGSEASSSPQNDTIGVNLSEAMTQNRGGSTPRWKWILWLIIIIYILIRLI
jgi:hypothetical protein